MKPSRNVGLVSALQLPSIADAIQSFVSLVEPLAETDEELAQVGAMLAPVDTLLENVRREKPKPAATEPVNPSPNPVKPNDDDTRPGPRRLPKKTREWLRLPSALPWVRPMNAVRPTLVIGAIAALVACSSSSSSSTTDAGSPAAQSGRVAQGASCKEYLRCLASSAPEAVGPAVGAYGPESGCWANAETAALCEGACTDSRDKVAATQS
jgi:hypothetical protein